jgi:hypothetical protein
MAILTWNLSTAPAQTPEYWLLFVDGFACVALTVLAPYTGPGTYSVDLTKIDRRAPMPSDGAAHSYSVALVGAGVVGPQSAAVSITLPPPAVVVTTGQSPPPPVWPVADSLATQ